MQYVFGGGQHTRSVMYLRIINKCTEWPIRFEFTYDCKSHGDDVFALVQTWLRGILMYYCAEEAGFVAQPLKVTLEAGRTQYLRIAYDEDMSMHGSATRAIARFVSTEWKPNF